MSISITVIQGPPRQMVPTRSSSFRGTIQGLKTTPLLFAKWWFAVWSMSTRENSTINNIQAKRDVNKVTFQLIKACPQLDR